MYVYILIYTHTYIYIYIHICIYIYIYRERERSIDIYIYIYTHVYVYIYIYIYTHLFSYLSSYRPRDLPALLDFRVLDDRRAQQACHLKSCKCITTNANAAAFVYVM